MRSMSAVGLLIAALAGCAPRQDPGIPLPPRSGAAAMTAADRAIDAPRADRSEFYNRRDAVLQ